MQQLRTTDFGEVCDFLGFTPALLHPEAVNAASVDFTAMTAPDLVRLDTVYSDADGIQLGMLSNLYFTDPENAYFTIEQSEEGQYIRIGQKDVYRTVNIDEPVFNWTSDSSVCNLYWMQEADLAISALEDFFSGHILTRDAESARHDVTAEEIMASTQQSTDQELLHLRTSDYAKVCEFLGFTPKLIRPEVLEAIGIDFTVEILPGRVRLDAYYLNVEGLAKNHFSIYYYTDPDKIPYYVEENKTGHFIDVCGHQVYTTEIYAQPVYSWRIENGVCAFYCDSQSDLAMPALEDYLSGNFMTMAAAATLPTGATAQQIADAIMRQDQQQLMTSDIRELCDFLGFTPSILRPEVFSTKETLYSASVWSDLISLVVAYQPEDPEYNVVMQIQYFRSVDEVYSNFEQSETGIFLSIAGTTVYCAPNLHRTSYAWVNNTVTYLLSGVLPKETVVPLLDAYFRGDQYTPDSPGT